MFLGRIFPGTSSTQTSGYPRQKLYASGLFCCFKQGVGAAGPGFGSGRPGFGNYFSNMQENFRLICLSLCRHFSQTCISPTPSDLGSPRPDFDLISARNQVQIRSGGPQKSCPRSVSNNFRQISDKIRTLCFVRRGACRTISDNFQQMPDTNPRISAKAPSLAAPKCTC